ncbi:hypothetical protein LCGC14_0238700 [marine sediment metagenome]|uniref:Uncharacterized protein n=1 Tax=marine sediment metagenome TaxID=412755 RepID=A0A0F9XCC5_9ZZZZ|nr:hypothetical protein [Phycisphaerae bacterium]HDZ42678.1 hypothetical protein [Phycisphaerae bacterium]
MTKRQLIDEIRQTNPSAGPDFLSQFDQTDLLAYLRNLSSLNIPHPAPAPVRYVSHFRSSAPQPAPVEVAPDALPCPAAKPRWKPRRDEVRRFFAGPRVAAEMPELLPVETVAAAAIERERPDLHTPTEQPQPVAAATTVDDSPSSNIEQESWLF